MTGPQVAALQDQARQFAPQMIPNKPHSPGRQINVQGRLAGQGDSKGKAIAIAPEFQRRRGAIIRRQTPKDVLPRLKDGAATVLTGIAGGQDKVDWAKICLGRFCNGVLQARNKG